VADWRDKIHVIELEPMTKAEAVLKEPEAIENENPLCNKVRRSPLAVRTKLERKWQEQQRIEQEKQRQDNERIAALIRRAKEQYQAERAQEVSLAKYSPAFARGERDRAWDGRLETYKNIYERA
jgi:hypothetical protein